MASLFKLEKRPGEPQTRVVTPMSLGVIALMGAGADSGGVQFTRDEVRALSKLYGYSFGRGKAPPAKPSPEPKDPGPSAPLYERERFNQALIRHRRENTPEILERRGEAQRRFEEAGAWRNCARHAESDGLRLVALMAPLCEPGQDPVRVLVEILREARFDVSWGEAEEETGEAEVASATSTA